MHIFRQNTFVCTAILQLLKIFVLKMKRLHAKFRLKTSISRIYKDSLAGFSHWSELFVVAELWVDGAAQRIVRSKPNAHAFAGNLVFLVS